MTIQEFVITVYNSVCQKMISKICVDGLNTIPVTSSGVVMIKVGDRVTKIIL